MNMKYCYAFLLAAVVLSGGCTTNYYAAAVKEARVYAIDKFPDLNEEALHCIRFTSPRIEQDIIYRKYNEYSHNAFAQTCFIWDIPEYDGKSLVVVGFSEKKLKDWYPIRAMFKRYRYIESSGDEKKESKSKKKSGKKNTILNLDRGLNKR